MALARWLMEKFGSVEVALKEANEKIKPNQRVGIRLDISPHTYITRIEDANDETVYIAGINEQEVNFSMPLANQELELQIFSDKVLYKTKVIFERRVLQPLHMWVLKRPHSATAHKERRSSYRLDNVLRAHFKIQHNVIEEEKEAVTRNISIGGLAIASQVNMAIGTKIEVRLSDIDDIKIAGEIVWKYQRSFSDKWYYGVRFIEIGADKESILAAHINKKLGQLRWAGLD